MILKDVLPSPHLQEYVRKHQIIRFVFGANEAVPAKAYAPRPEHCLVFYLRELHCVDYLDGSTLKMHHKCTLYGQHTLLQNRLIARDFWALQVVLQPGALFRLTGIPAHELTNAFIDAETVWGEAIHHAHEQMCNTENIVETITIAECFLAKAVQQSNRELMGVDRACRLMLQQTQLVSVDWIARQAYVSVRPLHRQFAERMGINPKAFDRITRFEKAFKLKNAQPQKDWQRIAFDLGYYDYQHLVRDFVAFNKMTPNGFLLADGKSPEREFGLVEVETLPII